jgi:tight adherence protein B
MAEIQLVYIFFFVSTMLLVVGGYLYYARDLPIQKKINRRIALIDKVQDRTVVLEMLRQERGVGSGAQWRRFQALQDLLIQSGLRLGRTGLFASIAFLSAAVTSAVTAFLGFSLWNLPLSLIVSLVLFLSYVRLRRTQRIGKFREQLPDVLDIVVRSLRAGHPLLIALSLVAREMPDPAGSEFGIATDEVTYGLDLTSAMRNLSSRVGDRDLVYVVTAIAIQSETGGNLGEILGRLSALIRERFKMMRKIRALTSEGRASAMILTGLPLVLFGAVALLSPTYFGEVWNHPVFDKALMTAGGMLVFGNFVMRRMVNFKV